MEIKNVCIATITWARDENEEQILSRSLEQLASLNIPVYLTDGGSSENFKTFLNSFSHFTIFEAKSLWPQARMSIREAAKSGAKFIFYTEPDKQEFFSKHLKTMLEQTTADDGTGVVIASRLERALATFPPFQQMTETAVNNCCEELIGKKIDYCYGPFLFNSKLLYLLEKIEDNIGWGWRPFLFVIAKRLGFEIKNYEGDFNCPQDQRDDNAEERIYRMKQLTQNTSGLILSTAMRL